MIINILESTEEKVARINKFAQECAEFMAATWEEYFKTSDPSYTFIEDLLAAGSITDELKKLRYWNETNRR